MDVDKDFLEFLRKNENEKLSLEFVGKIEEFRRNLRDIVKKVSQLIGEKIEDKNVKIWVCRGREIPKLFDIAVVDYYPYYPNKDVDVALDSRLTLNGWEFVLFTRHDKSNKLNDYIKKIDKYTDMKGKVVTDGRFKIDKTFNFDAIEEVSVFIADIINKLH